jgi:hypothetical protein
MKHSKWLFSIAALIIMSLSPAVSKAQLWSFIMLDASNNPAPGTLQITLSPVNSNAIPSNMTLNINGMVTDYSSTGAALNLGSFSTGYSSSAPIGDANPFFTMNGAGAPDTPGIPSWFGSSVDPSSPSSINLGTFDVTSFLQSLPADGAPHQVSMDFTLGATDSSLQNPFDPNNPDITPGPPSLLVQGQVNPTGGVNVPEPGVIGMLFSSLTGLTLFKLRKIKYS